MNQLLAPSGMAFLLALLGLVLAPWPRLRALSIWLFAGSAVTLLVFSSGMTAAALMGPLEYAYPSVHSTQGHPGARTIVVLTGYAADDSDMPLTGRLHASSAQRVTMTLQLHKSCPDCRVIVSGEKVTAKVMGAVLVELGLPPAQLLLEDRSRNTAQSARNLPALLRGDQFFLVTSAGHMLRTMESLRMAGLDAVAVPTDHQVPRRWTKAQFRPSPESLRVSDLAVHEYLGRLWYRLRGAA